MRQKKIFSGLVLLIAMVSLFTISANDAMAQAGKKKGKKSKRPPASVEVAVVMEEEVAGSVEIVGSARAFTQTAVSAEVMGRIVAFGAREGDNVKKGDVVVSLHDALFLIKEREAQGRLRQADAALKKAELAARRANELYVKKVASLENKEYADLDVEVAHANLELRTAELDNAKYNLDRTKISAPFTGFITRRYVAEGSWVEKGDKIFDMVDTSKVEVIAEIPEHLISAATKGKIAQLEFDAYIGKKFEGVIASLAPKANPKTRTFPVRIEMDNPGHAIKDGMFVRVSLLSQDRRKAMLIPRDAVVWRFRRALVFTAGAEGKVKSFSVKLGRQFGERVVATGDITTGQEADRDRQRDTSRRAERKGRGREDDSVHSMNIFSCG